MHDHWRINVTLNVFVRFSVFHFHFRPLHSLGVDQIHPTCAAVERKTGWKRLSSSLVLINYLFYQNVFFSSSPPSSSSSFQHFFSFVLHDSHIVSSYTKVAQYYITKKHRAAVHPCTGVYPNTAVLRISSQSIQSHPVSEFVANDILYRVEPKCRMRGECNCIMVQCASFDNILLPFTVCFFPHSIEISFRFLFSRFIFRVGISWNVTFRIKTVVFSFAY